MKNNLWSANIIFDIGGVLFKSGHGHARYKENPSQEPAPGVFEPINEGLTLLRDCARIVCPENKQPLHKLFILSNWHAPSFEQISQEHKDIFNLFSGVVISGRLPFKKPDPRIYEYLLQTHNLNPGESIFIDDFAHNIQIAETFGITGIHHTCPRKTRITLETLGVLQKAHR